MKERNGSVCVNFQLAANQNNYSKLCTLLVLYLPAHTSTSLWTDSTVGTPHTPCGCFAICLCFVFCVVFVAAFVSFKNQRNKLTVPQSTALKTNRY